MLRLSLCTGIQRPQQVNRCVTAELVPIETGSYNRAVRSLLLDPAGPLSLRGDDSKYESTGYWALIFSSKTNCRMVASEIFIIGLSTISRGTQLYPGRPEICVAGWGGVLCYFTVSRSQASMSAF